MPRRRLTSPASTIFHVLNRGVRRWRLFEQPADYGAFMQCLQETRRRIPVRLLAYCVMPNHFHLVLWPEDDPQLSEFMRLLTVTHSKRWHAFRGTHGTGHVYQGRFKAFPVQHDEHFLTVCRYVERNALRARLVARAEDWPWSSLSEHCRNGTFCAVDQWPFPQPPAWRDFVNGAPTVDEEERLRTSARRGAPFGDDSWTREIVRSFELEGAVARLGRPRS